MTIFLACAIGGFFLALIFGIFGGDSDMDFDADPDIGGSPGILSVRVMTLAVCGWGVAGGIATYGGYSMFASSLLGLIGAVIMGGIGYGIMFFLYRSQSPFIVRESDFVGMTARTMYQIPKDGVGQITCNVKGISQTLMAREENGEEISKDTIVEIVDKQGGIAIVKRRIAAKPVTNEEA